MSVPRLRFKADDGQEFPDWEADSLGNLFTIKAGGDISQENVSEVKNETFKYPVYANSDKNLGLYGYSDLYKIKESSITVTGRGNLGIAVPRYECYYPIVRLLTLIPKNSFDIYFGATAINKINFYTESTGVPQLTAPQLSAYEITFPVLAEQTKIANFLTAVDEKITQLTQKCDLLTQHKKGVMQQLFSRDLRFKDDDGQDFPEWEEKVLDDVALSISNGLNLDQSIERIGFMVTRIETISEKKINLEKVGYVQTEQDISSYKLDIGNILFSNINSISHIGKVVFIDKDYQLYHGMNLLRIVINATNNPKFIFYQLDSERMKQHFEIKANKAVNQASINQTELKKTKLRIPSKAEQTKIANFLTAIDDKITVTQTQLLAVKQYKQGLLQQMFV